MSNYYALRVDGNDPSALLAALKKYPGAYLVVKESPDGNPHFHAVIHTDAKLAAVRMALKRLLPEGGNGAYSATVVRDLDKYQRYMMKGESRPVMPNIVDANGWNYQDPLWQQECHDSYWDENDEISRKRKAAPVIETVLIKCKEMKYSWTNRAAIAEVFIREMSSRDKSINIFALKSQVNLLQIKLCPDDSAIQDLAAQI